MADRDGFIIRDAEGAEIHFVPCVKNGSAREMVFEGMCRRVIETDNYVCDTRDEED